MPKPTLSIERTDHMVAALSDKMLMLKLQSAYNLVSCHVEMLDLDRQTWKKAQTRRHCLRKFMGIAEIIWLKHLIYCDLMQKG